MSLEMRKTMIGSGHFRVSYLAFLLILTGLLVGDCSNSRWFFGRLLSLLLNSWWLNQRKGHFWHWALDILSSYLRWTLCGNFSGDWTLCRWHGWFLSWSLVSSSRWFFGMLMSLLLNSWWLNQQKGHFWHWALDILSSYLRWTLCGNFSGAWTLCRWLGWFLSWSLVSSSRWFFGGLMSLLLNSWRLNQQKEHLRLVIFEYLAFLPSFDSLWGC
jgi:hypothetical protein